MGRLRVSTNRALADIRPPRLQAVDGVIRYGGGFSGLLARYDDLTSTWYVYADQASWPTAVFTAA